MTSSSSGHSSDDRWYELLEPPIDLDHNNIVDGGDSPPPPLPARLTTSGSVSAFQQVSVSKSSSSSPHAKVTATHSLPLPQNTSFSLPVKYSSTHEFSDSTSPQHEFKVGEKVTTCLLKASERSHELRRQLERSSHDYHLVTRMPKVGVYVYTVGS